MTHLLDTESHCLISDSELFAAADDLAAWAIEHAAELAARDRTAPNTKERSNAALD